MESSKTRVEHLLHNRAAWSDAEAQQQMCTCALPMRFWQVCGGGGLVQFPCTRVCVDEWMALSSADNTPSDIVQHASVICG